MSSHRNTFVRSLHDVGAAAWFGGSLMGAVALNGASKSIADPEERAHVASVGWARWSPVAAAAVGAHLVGGLALIRANRGRLGVQRGVRANTAVKSVLTGAALATTAYSGLMGARVLHAGAVPAEGATVPASSTPDDVSRNQQRLRVLQWVTPALTGMIVVLGAQQGEQQRPTEVARDLAQRVADRAAGAAQAVMR